MNCVFDPKERPKSFEELWDVAVTSGCSHITILNGDVEKVGQFRKDPFRLLAYFGGRCGRPRDPDSSCPKKSANHLLLMARANPFSRLATKEVRKIAWGVESLNEEHLAFKGSQGITAKSVKGPSLILQVLPRAARAKAAMTFEYEAQFLDHQAVSVEIKCCDIQVYAKCEIKATVRVAISDRDETTQHLSKVMDITVPKTERRDNVFIVDCDLKGYSDVARFVSENGSSDDVLKLNNEIQQFISGALDTAGVTRAEAVLAETGDGALLCFRHAEEAESFCVNLHLAAQSHNLLVAAPLMKRHFRSGAARGDLSVSHDSAGGRRFGGLAMADAVRLQTAATIGTVVISEEVYLSLPSERQVAYVRSEAPGKRSEKFVVYFKAVYESENLSHPFLPVSPARIAGGAGKLRTEILSKSGELSEWDIDRVFWTVEIPPNEWPSHSLGDKARVNKLLQWAGNNLERLSELLLAIIGVRGADQR